MADIVPYAARLVEGSSMSVTRAAYLAAIFAGRSRRQPHRFERGLLGPAEHDATFTHSSGFTGTPLTYSVQCLSRKGESHRGLKVGGLDDRTLSYLVKEPWNSKAPLLVQML